MKYSGDPLKWVEFLSAWANEKGVNLSSSEIDVDLFMAESINMPKSCLDFYVALEMIGWDQWSEVSIYYDLIFKKMDEVDLFILSPAIRGAPICGGFGVIQEISKNKTNRYHEHQTLDWDDSVLAASYLIAEDECHEGSLIVNPLIVNDGGGVGGCLF